MTQEQELKNIGPYLILGKVGSGGLGEVFRAQHRESGQIVALKRLHNKYQNNKKLLGLFHKEIMIHSRVSHKHCLRFLGADLTPPNAHTVSEFIEGINCHYLIREAGAIPPIVTCCIMLDMLQGLEHLHCLDIVHSDMTPSNVIVEFSGRVVLADFGLSSEQEFENYEGMTVGTPGYQAPERLDHAPITALSDIYCAGIVMHELLKGERLFYNLNAAETRKKMGNLKMDWLATGNKDFDKHLKAILNIALNVKPARRYPSARDFMYALYVCLKAFNVRYTRRAILQWMNDKRISKHPVQPPMQTIYVRS
jgi:serine/threonine protein kinase